MAGKRFTPEHIFIMLCEAEVLLNQSNPAACCLPSAAKPPMPAAVKAQARPKNEMMVLVRLA